MNPGPFFYTDNTIHCNSCFFHYNHCSHFTLLQTNTIFHTIRLILCFQQDRWDWQPHCTVGAKYFVVLCAGSMLLLTPIVRPANVSGINLQIESLSPTGRFNLGFLIEGKLPVVLIIPSSWGFPTRLPSGHIKSFSGTVAGEEETFCKGSLSLSISLLCFCFG